MKVVIVVKLLAG